jgi:hypothetical protein
LKLEKRWAGDRLAVAFEYSRSCWRIGWIRRRAAVGETRSCRPQESSRGHRLRTAVEHCPRCLRQQRADQILEHLGAATAVVLRSIAPDRVEDPRQLAGQSDHRDSFSSPKFDLVRPELQGYGRRLPTGPFQCPCCLDQYPAQRRRSGLRNRETLLPIGARVFAWHQSQVRLDLMRRCESTNIVDHPTCCRRAESEEVTNDGSASCISRRPSRSTIPSPATFVHAPAALQKVLKIVAAFLDACRAKVRIPSNPSLLPPILIISETGGTRKLHNWHVRSGGLRI